MEIDPHLNEQVNAASEYCERVHQQDLRHLSVRLLTIAGLGLAAGLAYRAIRPDPKPHKRFARLIAEMEDGLRALGEPALRKASELAHEGAHTARAGLQQGEAGVEKVLRKATRQLRHFWS